MAARPETAQSAQRLTARLVAVALRVYEPGDRGRTKLVWLVCMTFDNCNNDPRCLLTDWPVTDAASAVRVFRFYRRRWAVEDTFKFIAPRLWIKELQILDFQAVRTVMALAGWRWGFCFTWA